MTAQILTQARLKELLHYCPKTGLFTWLVSRGKARQGLIAGWPNRSGYLCIRINSKNYFSHRLAHLYVVGRFPQNQVDHINRIKGDNRWVNIQNDVTISENQRNASLSSHNTSGHNGVSWHKQAKKWRASIWLSNKYKHLGLFVKKQDAIKARKAANIKYGFSKTHGE